MPDGETRDGAAPGHAPAPVTGSVPALRDLHALASAVARSAGEFLRGRRPVHVEVAATKSSPTDVVTQMDRDVEAFVRSQISAARPDDGFFGEEGDEASGTSGLTWVVDPIDGTVNYLYGIEAFAVSVAVVSGGRDPLTWTVLAGAVHDVAKQETWSAWLGGGAWHEEERVQVNPPRPLAECLVGTGFGYAAERRLAQAQVLVHVLPRVRDIRRIGSMALDLCLLAGGHLDLVYERGLQPWDHAAGGLVVTEAGGTVTGLRRRAADDRMLVAGREPAVAELASLLEEVDADLGA